MKIIERITKKCETCDKKFKIRLKEVKRFCCRKCIKLPKRSKKWKKEMSITILKLYKNNPEMRRKVKEARAKQIMSSMSIETKRKIGEAKLSYIKKIGGHPNMGRNETQILDELELSNNIQIERQYNISGLGYLVDGYCKSLNLVIEIDEKHHIYTKEKDKIRQHIIIKKLCCDFIRITDNFN